MSKKANKAEPANDRVLKVPNNSMAYVEDLEFEIPTPPGFIRLCWELTQGSIGFIFMPVDKAEKMARSILANCERYKGLESAAK